MEIMPGILMHDLFLYIKKDKILILSDLHIGYEESLRLQGILIPKFNFDDLLLRIEKAASYLEMHGSIEKVIINGDLKHEFGTSNIEEKRKVKKIVDILKKYGDVIIIEGNHDRMLRFLIGDHVSIVDKYVLGNILICHGDKILDEADSKSIETIIIGHEHPAIALKDNVRMEKFKCFLKGKYNKKNLLVTPSCNILIEGTDILTEKTLSPYIKRNSDFEVFVTDNGIYPFGKVKDLK